jgi:hypothetical protein
MDISSLNEISGYKNQYFNIQNYCDLALNQLNLKQIMVLKINTKELIEKLRVLQLNEERKRFIQTCISPQMMIKRQLRFIEKRIVNTT